MNKILRITLLICLLVAVPLSESMASLNLLEKAIVKTDFNKFHTKADAMEYFSRIFGLRNPSEEMEELSGLLESLLSTKIETVTRIDGMRSSSIEDVRHKVSRNVEITCDSLFSPSSPEREICWGMHFGRDHGNCFKILNEQQKLGCEAAVVVSDPSVRCEQIAAQPQYSFTRELCIMLRDDQRTADNLKTDDLIRRRDEILHSSGTDEQKRIALMSLGYRGLSPFFEIHFDEGILQQLYDEQACSADMLFGLDREKAIAQAKLFLDLVDSYLTTDLIKMPPRPSVGRLAKELGVKWLVHGTRCDSLAQMLSSGYIQANAPTTQQSRKSEVYQGVYFEGYPADEDIDPRKKWGGSAKLVFDTDLLDIYSNYHFDEGHRGARYHPQFASALSSDLRRLSYIFGNVGGSKGAYAHELVFRTDISLDNLSKIVLTQECFDQISEKSPAEFQKYRSKFEVFE